MWEDQQDAPRRVDYTALEDVTSGGVGDGREEAGSGFGVGKLGLKRITLAGSIVIITNTICGPGMVVLPQVYQQAGWVIPTLIFVLICISSSLSATFLCDTMARIPGNSRFERRIEFVNIFDELWGKGGLAVAQTMFMINMMAQTVSSIIANAQVMDNFIVFINPTDASYALELYPNPSFISWSPPQSALAHTNNAMCHLKTPEPFHFPGEPRLVVTLGYAILGVVLIPMSLMTLEENVTIQWASFIIMTIITLEFLWQFQSQGLDNFDIPAFGGDYTHVVGSIIFNYAYAAFIPSWVNEKKPEVSVNVSIWTSAIVSTVMYIFIGIMGALSYARAPGNFLSAAANQCSPTITRISAFVYAFGMIGLGIPFNCIVTRYSLQVGRACGPRWAIFWSVLFPWATSWLFYGDGMLGEIVSWAGDLAIGPLNFLFPLLAALTSLGVVGFTINWRKGRLSAVHEEVTYASGASAPKSQKHLRHSMSIASEHDFDDLANDHTTVEPLPRSLSKYYRPIATLTSFVLISLMLLSIASHSRKLIYRGLGMIDNAT